MSPNYRYRNVMRLVGRALHRHDMIADGDHVTVGVSGGKDSLTLLWMLNERLRRIPISYNLFPVHIDPGFEDGFGESLGEFCGRIGLDLHVEKTDYGPFAHSDRNRENPCFLCARLRRKRLFEIAGAQGSGKLALGHHKDDVIETLLLNMCYAGRISTMAPSQPMFGGALRLIRPLYLLDEMVIREFVRDMGFPEFVNPCPSANASKRTEIRTLLRELYRGNRKVKGNIFRSLQTLRKDYAPLPSAGTKPME